MLPVMSLHFLTGAAAKISALSIGTPRIFFIFESLSSSKHKNVERFLNIRTFKVWFLWLTMYKQYTTRTIGRQKHVGSDETIQGGSVFLERGVRLFDALRRLDCIRFSHFTSLFHTIRHFERIFLVSQTSSSQFASSNLMFGFQKQINYRIDTMRFTSKAMPSSRISSPITYIFSNHHFPIKILTCSFGNVKSCSQ